MAPFFMSKCRNKHTLSFPLKISFLLFPPTHAQMMNGREMANCKTKKM